MSVVGFQLFIETETVLDFLVKHGEYTADGQPLLCIPINPVGQGYFGQQLEFGIDHSARFVPGNAVLHGLARKVLHDKFLRELLGIISGHAGQRHFLALRVHHGELDFLVEHLAAGEVVMSDIPAILERSA